MLDLKRECGKNLLEKRTIFTALQRNVNKENNIAEQHLIDMLCQRYVAVIRIVVFLVLTDDTQWVRPGRYVGVQGT